MKTPASAFAHLSLLAILCVLLSAPPPAHAQANCHATEYRIIYFLGNECGGQSYEPSGGCPPAYDNVSWDFAAGTFFCESGDGGDAELNTTAVYTVGGLPAGTPVVVRARFIVTGALDCGLSNNSATISGPGPNGSWSGGQLIGSVAVEMLFDGLAGQPFEIACHMHAWVIMNLCGPWATISGTLEFYDVPAGAVIVPCQAPSASVPAGLQPRFALEPPSPNPTRRAFAVNFTLPSNEPSTLALYDIGGRLLTKMDLTEYGPGPHTVQFGEGNPLRPGVYLLRLVQGGHVASRQAIILQ